MPAVSQQVKVFFFDGEKFMEFYYVVRVKMNRI